MSRYHPFQDFVREYVRILRLKGHMRAMWFVREYDYKRCKVRRRKAVLAERNRCRRYAEMKEFQENQAARMFLNGAAMALAWTLDPKHDDRAVPPGAYAWRNFDRIRGD